MAWDEMNKEEKEEKVTGVSFKSLSEAEEKRGYKILSFGNFATGKTYFGLTFPEPIFVIDTENGASPLQKEFPDKNIKVLNVCERIGEKEDEKDEVLNLEKYLNAVDYLINLPDNEVGTIIIDSLSDVWDWCQAYAKTKIFKIPIENRFNNQFDWGIPNALFRKQLLKLINKNCNVIFTARESEKYAGAGQPMGIFEPKVQKKTPYFVDIVLQHVSKISTKDITFSAMIQKCRYKGELIGKTIINPTYDKFKEIFEK